MKLKKLFTLSFFVFSTLIYAQSVSGIINDSDGLTLCKRLHKTFIKPL